MIKRKKMSNKQIVIEYDPENASSVNNAWKSISKSISELSSLQNKHSIKDAESVINNSTECQEIIKEFVELSRYEEQIESISFYNVRLPKTLTGLERAWKPMCKPTVNVSQLFEKINVKENHYKMAGKLDDKLGIIINKIFCFSQKNQIGFNITYNIIAKKVEDMR
jgi:hypothetical protein